MDELVVTVNGEEHRVPRRVEQPMLVDWLRQEAHLTGTKVGCNAGGCGACTVMLTEPGPGGARHRPALACLTPLALVHGCHVTTIEGVSHGAEGFGSGGGSVHPIQRQFSEGHASQCGFCTPGQVMSLYTLLSRKPEGATAADIETALAGNLCRCTGYRTILNAAKTFACDNPRGNNAEATTGLCGVAAAAALVGGGGVAPAGRLDDVAGGWVAPTDLATLCAAKLRHPSAAVVAGGTAVGLQLNGWRGPKDGAGRRAAAAGAPSHLLSTAGVPELHGCAVVAANGGVNLLAGEFDESEAGDPASPLLHVPNRRALRVGAAASLKELEEALTPLAEDSSTASAFLAAIHNFGWGGAQLRAAATLGGSVVFAPTYSNFVPLLCAVGATFKFVRAAARAGAEPMPVALEERLVTATCEAFLPDGGGLKMEPEEVLVQIFIPLVGAHSTVLMLKPHGSLKDDSSLSVACAATRDASGGLASCRIVFGGLQRFVELPQTAALLCSDETVETAETTAAALVLGEMDSQLGDCAVGGRVEYRKVLALSFVHQLAATLLSSDDATLPPPPPAVVQEGSWKFPLPDGSTPSPVGQPLPKLDASGVTTGEAEFVDDIPSPPGCVHLAFVLSTQPRAKITAVDTSKALAAAGVWLWVDDGDSKRAGTFAWNGRTFEGSVSFVGDLIGAVAADSVPAARAAAALVEVVYSEQPAVLTMDEAVAAGNILPVPPAQPTMGIVAKGDTTAAFESAAKVIKGEICIGGQEHFYLEPFAFLAEPARPGAGEPLQLTLCSQSLSENQRGVAAALGVGSHEVAVKARRLGGGFGGKAGNMNDLASAVAIAATLLKKPARAVLRREEDFALSGKRESLRGRYTVGLSADGQVSAFALEILGNGGVAPARGTMIKGLMNGALSYGRVPNVRLDLTVVSSNIQSNTAMRALSVPGVAMICEAAFEHASRAAFPSPANLPQRLGLRAAALATPTDKTPFGQLYGDDCNAGAVWSELLSQAKVEERIAECTEFNAANRWKKRGIHAMPSVFGVTEAMTGGAMVNIYLDGTVLVHHGGIEMGQGIHVKMAQIVAGVLQVEMKDVRVAETSTDIVPNTSKTAAAAGVS
jgi:xanthine dehydrogenase/oxidase